MDIVEPASGGKEKEYFRIEVEDLVRIGECRSSIELMSHLLSKDMLEQLGEVAGEDVLYTIASTMRISAEELDRLIRSLPFDENQDKAA